MERLATTALDELLARAQSAIAAGAVTLISCESVRQRSGERWPRKREQVDAFVDRAFSRLAAPGDVIAAVNEAEFVMVQPGASQLEALGLSANILKETLSFFLGAVQREDLRLFQVTACRGGQLEIDAIDLDQLARDQLPPRPGGAAPPPPIPAHVAAAPPLDDVVVGAPRRCVRLVSRNGEIDVALSCWPVWNIEPRAVPSALVHREVRSARNGALRPLPSRDLSAALAGEVALLGLREAEAIVASGGSLALHVTLPVAAVSYSTSRYRVLRALRELPAAVGRRLVLELIDLEEGFPPSRIAELAVMLSPFARAVLARAPGEGADVGGWRGCGLAGVTLDGADLDPSDRRLAARLASFATSAESAAPACVAYNLASRSLVLAAWAAGFTHLSGPAVLAGPEPPRGGLRLHPEDLYRSRGISGAAAGHAGDRSQPQPARDYVTATD